MTTDWKPPHGRTNQDTDIITAAAQTVEQKILECPCRPCPCFTARNGGNA